MRSHTPGRELGEPRGDACGDITRFTGVFLGVRFFSGRPRAARCSFCSTAGAAGVDLLSGLKKMNPVEVDSKTFFLFRVSLVSV
jgi:hypothetical protein